MIARSFNSSRQYAAPHPTNCLFHPICRKIPIAAEPSVKFPPSSRIIKLKIVLTYTDSSPFAFAGRCNVTDNDSQQHK
jgi:hypothetical protein